MTEKRTSDGGFAYIDDGNERKEGAIGKEVQEVEITFDQDANSNGFPKPSFEAASNRIALSNRQLKARLRRYNLGFVLDLNPDLQMANVSHGVILMAHNITHIINCATGVKNIFLGKIKYLTLDVLDLPWTNLEQYFDECHEFMRKAVDGGGNVCFCKYSFC
ncbi:unnamed protein product [Gongylonema pulchrum]|uniref:DSPc domain-containing protein n=1 Tax=Gongylonema pulchrum TaxID=637853 RepID=A0A183D317_9BILA|nr:unnamed protein product [Gongylonema pulchrum]